MRRGQEIPSPSSQLRDPTPTRIAHALPFALLGESESASFSAVCHPLVHCSSREFPSLSRSRSELAWGRMRAWFGRWIEEKPLSPELAAGRLRQMQGSLWLPGELSPSCHWLRQPTGASQRFLRTFTASRWVWETTTSAHQADWDAYGSFLEHARSVPELRKSRKMLFLLSNLFYPKFLAQPLFSCLIPKMHEHISMVSC